MSFTVIIPARYASQRLPGKPLMDIAGKPMIERVYQCAHESDAHQVIVATDNKRIYEVVQGFGGQACMTSAEHPSGTDRLQEVVQKMQLAEEEIVVNVQGDEPLIPPSVINQVAHNLSANAQASAATLCEALTDINDLKNPNIVKVVKDMAGMALYFSRAPVPWDRERYQEMLYSKDGNGSGQVSLGYRHIGIYAYRVALLNQFICWPLAVLEGIEKLEQLRILANGQKIHIEESCTDVPGGVDTEEDLGRIRAIFTQKIS